MTKTDTSLITGVSHLVLKVSDLDASVAWYRDALGLEAFRREPTRFVGMRSASGFQVGLFTGGQPNNSGALDHIAFTVSDLDALTAWADHLTAIGIAHEGIKPNPFGHSIDLFDPDGNNIELVSEAQGHLADGTTCCLLRPVAALAMKSATLRRLAWGDATCHADRLTVAQSLELLDDIIGCTVNVDDLVGSGEQIALLDPLPCPVTIAWSENDPVVPVAACDKIARERVPGASFTILPGLRHALMIDDPDLVARTILAVTGAG